MLCISMTKATAIVSPIEYETTVFTLKDDSLGSNRATLLHARSEKNGGSFYRTLLYIHGYSDYYFQYVNNIHLQNNLLFSSLVIICVQNFLNRVTIFSHWIYENVVDQSFHPSKINIDIILVTYMNTMKRLRLPSNISSNKPTANLRN